MISNAILQLCAVSIICGLVLTITPSGTCKTAMQILCTAVLISAILEPVADIDFESYSSQRIKAKELEEAFLQNASEAEENLSKTVIQQECCEYILDKARSLGIEQIDISVTLSLNNDDLWVPYAVQITAIMSDEQRQNLAHILDRELGIPEERQTWIHV